MEGLKRQVELLYAALQPLDVDHSCHRHEQPTTLPDEAVSELQVALARATALAHWATAVQREQLLQQRPSGGSGAPSLQCGASAQQQTLGSVAELFKVSIADIRQWNPQLPFALREDDVLPPDTLVAGSTGSSGVAVSGHTSAKTQGTDAGHGHGVAARRHNSAASSTRSSCSSRTAGGAGTSITGVCSGVFPCGSEGGASQGRYSAWTADSGRGSSRSPQVPELSMPNSCANAAPPSCAPEPVMMSVCSNSCSPPDRYYLIDLKEDVMESSPTPKSDASANGKARCSCSAPKDSTPSPPVPSLAPPPLFPGAATLPAAAAAGATPWHDSFPRQDFIDDGSSVTSVQELCTRGHSRFSPCSPIGGMPTVSAVTSKGRHSDIGPMAPPGASSTASQIRPPSSLADGESDGREPRRRTAGSAAAVSAVPPREAKGGARALALPSPARETSASLSAVSPPSSLGADGRSNSAHSRMRAGGAAGEGELCGAEVPRHQWLSPMQHRQRASALSPSLAAPSDTSSCSPVAKEQCPSATTASKAAVNSGDIHSPSDFLTPVQHRGCRGPQRTADKAFSSTGRSDMEGSPASASCSFPGGHSGIEAEASESPRSDTEDYMEDEEERTPSMRPPAMLGCHSSQQLRQKPGVEMDASPSPPSLAAPSILEPPQQRLQEWSELDDPLEGSQLAGGEDYDTLEGIAAAYNLTVSTIIEWNPYLKKYRPSEPLPPDLPIVLPMSSEDEEDGEETNNFVREADSELLRRPRPRLGNHTPGGYSPSGALDNSPTPLRPL
ncbi:LysM domain family protein [Leishmania donovani]|uniref:LysM domain family protein n=1 Tax=Leishmania donovani TaxID=5661 RepID=A0A504XYM2_LEIDO|nr:LysM domain family protein [Leishmania donovani]